MDGYKEAIGFVSVTFDSGVKFSHHSPSSLKLTINVSKTIEDLNSRHNGCICRWL